MLIAVPLTNDAAYSAPNGPDISISGPASVAQGASFDVNVGVSGSGFDPYSGYQAILSFDAAEASAQSATTVDFPGVNEFQAPTLIDNPGGTVQIGSVLLAATTSFTGDVGTVTFQAANIDGCATINLEPHTGAASEATGSFTIDPADNVSAQNNSYPIASIQVLIGTGTVSDCGLTPPTNTPTATNTAGVSTSTATPSITPTSTGGTAQATSTIVRTVTPSPTVGTPQAGTTPPPAAGTPGGTTPGAVATQPGGGAGPGSVRPPDTGTGSGGTGDNMIGMIIGGVVLVTAGGGLTIAGLRRRRSAR